MFGFLKNKLKEWVDKAKDKVKSSEKAEKQKETEKQVEEEIKKEKVIKKPKIKEEPKKQEIKKEAEVKKESIEERIETFEKIKEQDLKKPKEESKKDSFFQRLKTSFIYKINEQDFNELFEDLEMLLLENNVALEVVEDIKKSLSIKLIGKEIKKEKLEQEIKKELKNSLYEILIDPDDPIDAVKLKKNEPFVILFFGINGTGKTTSIAKIANLLKKNNYSVVIGAGDTFRAASIEQISEHAKNLDVPLIKQDYGTDPSAVGFDTIKYAKNHKINAVLIDTAGRMHTKTNLLAEMEKIVRVTNPDLKVFVAESIAGNDAIEQAKTFNELIGIDGSILTKADVDEKGGTIISISHVTKKPIFYLGTGQKYEDLKLFNKQDFIKSLGLE
jgi:fused signal recognition particle receptor